MLDSKKTFLKRRSLSERGIFPFFQTLKRASSFSVNVSGFILVYSLLSFLAFAQYAGAQGVSSSMKNSSYILRTGNFNTAAGRSTGSGTNLNITVGQLSPGLYTGANFKLRAGFQYIPGGIPFSFSISSSSINFGLLEPTNPVTRTNILTVSNRSSGGYVVSSTEDHELKTPEGALIPDTTCDSGTCNETASGTWSNTLTYGFGYRCDGVGTNYCADDFSDSAAFKQFANRANSEDQQTVMKGTSGRNHKSQITYKVNVSGSQAAGYYTNTITYVATPTY